jgi:hypothetical protein
MNYLNYVQSLIKTGIDAIVALLPASTMAAATDISTTESNIRGGTNTLETLASAISGIAGATAVMKTVTFSSTGASTIPLFTITGWVKIKLSARCKTDCVPATAANIRLGLVGDDDAFIVDTDVSKLDAGEIWNDNDPTSKYDRYYDAVFEYEIADGGDIQIVTDAEITSGVMEFAIEYLALSSDGNVVAA